MTERLMTLNSQVADDIAGVSIWDRLQSSDLNKRVKNSKKIIKTIYHISTKFSDMFKSQTSKNLARIKFPYSHRKRINSICEKQAENISKIFYNHFYTDNRTTENFENVMQAIFFPTMANQNSYAPFVHQFGDYVIKHREYLSTLSLDDFLHCNVD